MELAEYTFDELEVGKTVEFTRTLTTQDVETFASLTGDHNPLHMDSKYASTTQFGERISHGMLASSLFSTLVGMLCPGKRNLYLSQSLEFHKPIPLNSTLIVRGEITQKMDSFNVISMRTTIHLNGTIAIKGEAKVKVL